MRGDQRPERRGGREGKKSLSPDEEVWHKIACRTGGGSVYDLKRKTPAREYWRWVGFFENEVKEKKVEHWYQAQIASELACVPFLVWGQQPPAKLRDPKTFLLDFVSKEEKEERDRKLFEERLGYDAALSEKVWGAVLAVKGVQGATIYRGTPENPLTFPPAGQPPANPPTIASVPLSPPAGGIPLPTPPRPTDAKPATQKAVRVWVRGQEI